LYCKTRLSHGLCDGGWRGGLVECYISVLDCVAYSFREFVNCKRHCFISFSSWIDCHLVSKKSLDFIDCGNWNAGTSKPLLSTARCLLENPRCTNYLDLVVPQEFFPGYVLFFPSPLVGTSRLKRKEGIPRLFGSLIPRRSPIRKYINFFIGSMSD